MLPHLGWCGNILRLLLNGWIDYTKLTKSLDRQPLTAIFVVLSCTGTCDPLRIPICTAIGAVVNMRLSSAITTCTTQSFTMIGIADGRRLRDFRAFSTYSCHHDGFFALWVVVLSPQCRRSSGPPSVTACLGRNSARLCRKSGDGKAHNQCNGHNKRNNLFHA